MVRNILGALNSVTEYFLQRDELTQQFPILGMKEYLHYPANYFTATIYEYSPDK
ncbi:MAG: hypothetical protein M3015_03805 [Bacteroidota bacterium]|nr:hypothetical protein [Bacteroidota bacterium]